MAKMIPSQGAIDTNSFGESTVFSLLRDGLPEEYTVIHSLPWLCSAIKKIDSSFAPTGEIDFLIIHEDLGVLALEVKSGAYRVEGSIFVHVRSQRASNPVMQTRKNSHGLARWLGCDESLRIRIGYGFVFPDSSFGENDLGPALTDRSTHLPSKIFVQHDEMSSLSSRVVDIMAYWKAALNNPPLGREKANAILSALCPQYDGTLAWGARILFDNHMWLRLTKEQASAVERALNKNKTVITGWPGTGKTLIGIEVARRLSNEGKNVLFLTFNSLLAENIKLQLKDAGSCTVSTWHTFCHQAKKKIGVTSDENIEPQDWFQNQCCDDLAQAIKRGLIKPYDAIVVDEAQAFNIVWHRTLLGWLGDKPAIFFADESQVFSFEKNTTEILSLCNEAGIKSPYYLTSVIRMPRKVTKRLIEARECDYQLHIPRPEEDDTLREILTDDWVNDISLQVQKLCLRGIAKEDILILTRLEPSEYFRNLVSNLGVRHALVSRYRGLESPVVIILGCDKMSDSELFCAYSRATTLCIAIYMIETLTWKIEGAFQNILAKDDVNARKIDRAYNDSLTTNIINHENDAIKYSLHTVDLYWSKSWGSWLVHIPSEGGAHELWADYLVQNWPWKVYAWSGDARRKISLILKDDDEGESYVGRLSYKLFYCDDCKEYTPHHIHSEECSFCKSGNCLASSQDFTLESNVVSTISMLDELIYRNLSYQVSPDKVELQVLPLPLAAMGARLYSEQRAKQFNEDLLALPPGKYFYRSALAFVQSRALLLKPGKMISHKKLAGELYSRYEDLKVIDGASWQTKIAQALSTLYGKGLIAKIDRGIYGPPDSSNDSL
ncbi:nuclease-related domain-containing DEAD/DEAH box helicase [Pseudomonas oligotrophica]|uniref:nuclease-related domain-containing DEAD/DEAH box helicase n=1 Tax=Pseudomonas oligotrophica TaxID=2912055 RepID=UPI001F19D87B|nr:NERD domain-containing protein/DEAD/DEAH box helicase [Pseudomonas oligotrophica]MCF7202520.1 NERD domain-containing protein/DEAD/DEAH box helicase [Pseudomonas oligotrophica]